MTTTPDHHWDRRRFTRAAIGITCMGGWSARQAVCETNTGLADLPKRYERVVLRLDPNARGLERALRYEGNNLDLRGPRDGQGLFRDSGARVAERWRQAAHACAGIFVLRDSLWSQQDHPTRQRCLAPYLPASWITSAALAVHDGEEIPMPTCPPVADDDAWGRLSTPASMFGSAPISKAWHRVAVRPIQRGSSGERRQAEHARTTARELAAAYRRMIEAGRRGPDAAIATGVEIACDSDRRYFTASLRRDKVIPITVTRPDPREIEEGKGFVPAEAMEHPDAEAMASRVQRALLQRRLLDGDIAIERYDISSPAERRRVGDLLEQIVPRGAPAHGGGDIWVWINGPLDPHRKLRGRDAIPWVSDLRRELAGRPIDLDRVRLLSKPSIDLPSGVTRRAALDRAIDEAERLDLPVSLNMRTPAFRMLMD